MSCELHFKHTLDGLAFCSTVWLPYFLDNKLEVDHHSKTPIIPQIPTGTLTLCTAINFTAPYNPPNGHAPPSRFSHGSSRTTVRLTIRPGHSDHIPPRVRRLLRTMGHGGSTTTSVSRSCSQHCHWWFQRTAACCG